MILIYRIFTLLMLVSFLGLARRNWIDLSKLLMASRRSNDSYLSARTIYTLFFLDVLYVLPPLALFISTFVSMPILTRFYMPIPWVLFFYLPGLLLVKKMIQYFEQSRLHFPAQLEDLLHNLIWLCYFGMFYASSIIIVIWVGFLSRLK